METEGKEETVKDKWSHQPWAGAEATDGAGEMPRSSTLSAAAGLVMFGLMIFVEASAGVSLVSAGAVVDDCNKSMRNSAATHWVDSPFLPPSFY